VFVNWAKLACIIGRMLHEEEIPYLYYFGDMTRDQKDAAILEFQENPGIKVLVSLTPTHLAADNGSYFTPPSRSIYLRHSLSLTHR
jgi:hypothetical protein